ncbi:cysteine-rich motor neuron 1 protein-like [Biomphalaria glabrata]|uniref:Cysteine-rich motor neuron 1 protein-like n=1 Tax=Biomphalaria glabrata TaxID=6526 RepID=A0A9W3A3C6_BIOGL|nr:cysteine-rich motor neuron 1 protein-like [Biomphalaria glabrata]
MWILCTQCTFSGGSPTLLFLLMTWTVLWDIVWNFQCPPCHRLHCSPRRASKLQCKGGVTTGVCGCCPVCAKQEGEECGGHYAYRGKCDRNLDCVLTTTTSAVISSTHTLQTEPVGICKKMTKKPARGHQADATFVEFCRPPCTAEFCSHHPRALCSASEVVEVINECQGRCQHTSCSACSFQHVPNCPKCRKNDFRCIKKFGKCIRKQACSVRKKTCKFSFKQVANQTSGKFLCKLPGCL